MIKEVKLVKELVVTKANKIGILANISKVLADNGVNIEGVAGYAIDKEASIMLVADDSARASDALKKAGYKPIKENEVILIELVNKPGALKSTTEKLAAGGIDIRYAYGTVCPAGCPTGLVVSTSDNEKAVVLLKKQ